MATPFHEILGDVKCSLLMLGLDNSLTLILARVRFGIFSNR